MKRKMKILLSVTVVILLVVMGLHGMNELFIPEGNEVCMNYIKTFHALPERSAEVMIYGSSHAWRGCDSREMYTKHGIAAYNYGCNWQHMNTTALFLQDSFRTQRPKVALIETMAAGELLQDVDLIGEVYYTRAIPMSRGKWEYLKQCFGNRLERYLTYTFPVLAFHDQWTSLTKGDFTALKNEPENGFHNFGFMDIKEAQPQTMPDHTLFQQKEICAEAKECLDQMVALCRENNTEIVFFTTPYIWEYPYAQAMEEYASANGYPYLNLFDSMEEIGLDSQTDFSDGGHLNTSGAKKVADYLGAFLKEHYELTDYRDDPDSLWTKLLGEK